MIGQTNLLMFDYLEIWNPKPNKNSFNNCNLGSKDVTISNMELINDYFSLSNQYVAK